MAKEVSFEEAHSSLSRDLKLYRQRDLRQTLFFKVASRTFGPPKSRLRRIIAPPMESRECERSERERVAPVLPNSRENPDRQVRESVIPEIDPTPSCTDWISERKKLRSQLDSMGDVEKWLLGKPSLTETEVRVQDRISEERSKSQKSHATSQVTVSRNQCVNTPRIQQPSPEALAILDRYLHQRRMRLVDLYNQTDKNKMKTIYSKDLKAVRKEAQLPLSNLQVENLIVSLSSKSPNCIEYKELSRGRYVWGKENVVEHHRNMMAKSVGYFLSPEDHKPSHANVQSVSVQSGSFQDVREGSSLSSGLGSSYSRSQFLQVPPTILEEMRPVSYEDMEEMGKAYREGKRRAKSHTRLLDWLEQCRLVRSGNPAVDAHSLPSTFGGEMADLVDQYRRQCLQQYHTILKLCHVHRVCLSEKLLERALLYPGDKLIQASGYHLNIRQPGINTFSIKDLPRARSSKGEASHGGLEMDAERKRGIPSKTPYPPRAYVKRVKVRVRGDMKGKTETLSCWTTFEKFQEMICNLKRRFPYYFRTSEDNAFWPGHLVDKLRIYLPQACKKQQSLERQITKKD
ncbi:EF-hand calcium-binding domain-containing protein 12 [Pelodytes ibericus]